MRQRPAYASGYNIPVGIYPSLERRGDYASELYGNVRTNLKEAYEGLERTANWVFDRKHPYKAAGFLGGLGGFITGALMFAGLGPLAIPAIALTTGVGATATGIPATMYHWIWGREGENKDFPPYLDGMSIGKRIRQYVKIKQG